MKKTWLKKLLAVSLALVLAFAFTACGKTDDGSDAKSEWKVGFSNFDLTNVVFAELATELESYGKELGFSVTVADCQNDPSKQLTQLENFLTAGMDCIILSALDSDAVQPFLKEARDKGVKLISYGFELEGVDSMLMSDNYLVGYEIGRAAAEWINDAIGEEVEVALFNSPEYAELVKRENGIKDALNDLCPNAKIVATSAALTVSDGMTNMENILQANPNIQVVVSIGDGGALGALEVFQAQGKTGAEFGIFGCDATVEAMQAITNGTAFRSSISLGGGKDHARSLADMAKALPSGEKLDMVVPLPMFKVDETNVAEYNK